MNENKKTSTFLYVLKIALPLVVICGVIALLVATVNYFTAPVIERNNEEALKNAIAELFDGESVAYAEMPIKLDEADAKTVDAVYLVRSGEEVKGYCVKLSPACFKGDVDMIVSLDPSAFVTGVKIVSTNDETSGIGTKVTEKSFTEQFIETSESTLSGNYKDYVISGATKTSKPVTEAVFTAKRIVTVAASLSAVAAPSAGTGEQTENTEETEGTQGE